MGQTQYGFVRDYANAQAYDDYRSMGLGGLLMNVEDPRFTAGLQSAIQRGFQGGLWIPAHDGEDPIAYARRMAEYSQRYHPSMLVPDIEFQGKGYKGSPGWDWSEKMMAEFRRLSPDQQLAVSVMGNQDDFNYEAYTGRGAQVWSQAYDGSMNPFDTEQMRQQLIKRGVDPSLINITLAPNGAPSGGGNYSVYALDDLTPAQRARMRLSGGGEYQQGPATVDQVEGGDPAAPEMTSDQLAQHYLQQFRQAALPRMRSLSALAPKRSLPARLPVRPNPRSVAVQTLLSRPPTRAQTMARRITKTKVKPKITSKK